MKILVTGAAGFIGSHLAQKFASLGHNVVGVDCFTDYYSRALKELNAADLKKDGVELLRSDLAEDPLDEIVRDVDAIFHLAAQPGNSERISFETYLRNNLIATRRLADAALKVPTLKGFVNIATSSVYGKHATDSEDVAPKPISHYGVTKLAAEQLVLAYAREKGFPACSVRIFSVYGPRERPDKLYSKLIRCILENEEFPLFEGSLEHSRSFTYIEDVLKGFVAISNNFDTCAAEIFNIGSDIEITTGDGIRIVEQIMGKKAKLAHKPRRPGDQLRTHANIDKAKQMLGYAPLTPPEEGLRAQVEWYQQKVWGKVTV